VAGILIVSSNPALAAQWEAIIPIEHNIGTVNNITDIIGVIRSKPIDILIIDANILDANDIILNQIKDINLKTLIIGHDWSEERQIHVLVSGMSGYCEHEDTFKILPKAIDSIFKGDIWIQRHLVPKVIGQLVKLTNAQTIQSKKSTPLNKNLHLLTHRELDVAKLICSGENNKTVASILDITERTVKAHVTSIFQKLDVPDRLHLAILFKEII